MAQICCICNIGEEADITHLDSPLHRFNYFLYSFNNSIPGLVNDRHGVNLDIDIHALNGFQYNFSPTYDKHGCYYLKITPDTFLQHNQQFEFKCKLTNNRTRNLDPIAIIDVGLLMEPYPCYSMEKLQRSEDERYVILNAGEAFTLSAFFELEKICISSFKMPIYFSIQTLNENKEKVVDFTIIRSIVIAITEESTPDVITKSPFTRRPFLSENVIPPQKKIIKLDEYDIPHEYRRALFTALTSDDNNGSLQEIREILSAGEVTAENYDKFFHILLWLEEACDIIGLSCYNMENVHLTYLGADIIQLEVPGLAEKRPSVIKGDIIEIKPHGDHTSYQGVIEMVTENTVEIHYLHSDIIAIITSLPELEMDVHFILSRLSYERMHQAVKKIVDKEYVWNLFPDTSLSDRSVIESHHLTKEMLFNKSIGSNIEQFTAVEKILNNTSKQAPYIIYGPPGTGKSVTMIEAIYQLKQRFDFKILVCAAANATCDMLTQRLSAFCQTSELKRILSENCEPMSVPKDIRPYCNLFVDGNELMIMRFDKNNANNYKIIVTTLVLVGKLARYYKPNVIFIDEAAQPREPESAIAISLLKQGGQLVLAGDHNQLGPSIRSIICKKYKYDISLLGRLINLPLYQNDNKNNFITMLKQNFRSHKDILQISNETFYNNNLEAKSLTAHNDPLSRVCVFDYIFDNKRSKPRTGQPLEFCSVIAKESREGKSPSYFNRKEEQMVVKYVEALVNLQLSNGVPNIVPNQIGIITPYIRQMYKIKASLHHKYPDIEVGTTEAFQGREKRIIIISTVRGQEDLLLFDKKYRLGFVGEEKRVNVAITRAMSKCIIIGNPLVLTTDLLWEKIVKTSMFCGTPYVERTRAVRDEINKTSRSVTLTDVHYCQNR